MVDFISRTKRNGELILDDGEHHDPVESLANCCWSPPEMPKSNSQSTTVFEGDPGKQVHVEKREPFWETIKRNVVNVILSYIHKEDCISGKYQTVHKRCSRYFNMYAADVFINRNLSEAVVMEINNDPSLL